MRVDRVEVDVAVVGGGPVGIYLAAELQRRGVECVVLEQRLRPVEHSRSIGIHPPALEALAAGGATRAIVENGVLVREGVAFAHGKRLGTLAFDDLPSRYPFVVTLPQDRTEAILHEVLERVAPGRVFRGRHVKRVTQTSHGAEASGVIRDVDGAPQGGFRVDAKVLVACDGRDSTVRSELGLGWRRRRYPDTYVMGDVQDETGLGEAAAIYLERNGVVESFPLPGGRRRWVVKTADRMHDVTADDLARLVQARVGVDIDPGSCSMTSSFGIERGVAERFGSGRVLLAGDSAHIVPPIGGQGMNLGWLDAQDLVGWLPAVLKEWSERAWNSAVDAYDARRRRAFRTAAWRADLNVRLGRATPWSPVRNWLIERGLAGPFASTMARAFTMHGLASGDRVVPSTSKADAA